MSADHASDPNPPGLYSPPANAPVPFPPGWAPSPAEPAPVLPAALAAPPPPPGFPPPPVFAAPPQAPPAPPAPVAPPAPSQPSTYTAPTAGPAPLYAPPGPLPATPRWSAAGIGTRLQALPLTVKLAVAGAGLVGLAGLYLVAGVLLANAEAKSQTEAIQQTGADLTKIDAFLSDVSVRDAEKLDAKAFKAAEDAYAAKLAVTNATLTADQDRIDSTRGNIEWYGWLTPFETRQLHANDATFDQASAALATVVKAVAIFRTQTNFGSIFVSAEVHSDAAVAAAKKNDLATATTEFQRARNDLSQAELLAKDSDVAPQFAPIVGVYGNLMRDIAGLAESAQSSDGVGAVQYLRQLDADSRSPVTFDQQAYRAWYSKKIDPLEIDFRKHAHRVPRYVVTSTQLV
jgi:hypothetical protein